MLTYQHIEKTLCSWHKKASGGCFMLEVICCAASIFESITRFTRSGAVSKR